MKAQKITIDEQEKIVELLKRNYEQLKASNAQAERLVEAQTALIMAEKKLEIAKEIAKNKDSHIGFDSIAGYDAEKFILTSSFINLVEEERSGQIVEIPNGILFFGPIGNGKTSFAKAFATSAGCNFEKAKPNSSARTKEAREESFYKDLLEKAKTAQEHFITTGQRTIILADEFDRYANKGSSVVPKLKRFLENCSENYHCTVFATTNNPLDIPAELRSERRMPIKVCLDPPDKINAALVFKHYLKDASNVEMSEINPEKLAEQICSVQPDSSYNNSQIEYICSECITKYDKITQDVILREIENTEPAISNENMNKYRHEKT
ncbi:MAG: ATP-binding protein, partial [Candidatus Gastranaerophilales bacterium]|nr:ATP-binding protein [Candidatus Gastranaerophilales bacterium]